MANGVEDTAAGPIVSQAKALKKYASCEPKRVDVVSVMAVDKVIDIWNKIYAAADIANGGEATKLSLRCAVYCYLALNGTSPVGEYSGDIVSGLGTSLAASAIPAVVSRHSVRRFARGNAAESVEYFHATDVLAKLEGMRAKCEVISLPVENAIALCDWLDGATGLTPRELEWQVKLKNHSLSKSRASRGGKGIEELRDATLDDTVRAQGSEHTVLPPSNVW